MASGLRTNRPARKSGWAALRPRVAREALLDAVPDMMFLMSGDGRYLDFKPAKDLEPFLPPSEFLGKHVSEVLPKDIAEGATFHMQQAIATDDTTSYVYQLPLPDGPRDYEARIVPVGQGEILAIVRDITAERQSGLDAPGRLPVRYGLTPRETAVLRLVTLGVTDKEIGRRLSISPMTVRKHVARVLRKMTAASRTEASVRAVREGWLG